MADNELLNAEQALNDATDDLLSITQKMVLETISWKFVEAIVTKIRDGMSAPDAWAAALAEFGFHLREWRH